jgi:protein-disulfide isomerase
VNGTPTFFINGIRFDGDWSDWRDFSSVLSRVARATGVAR